MLYRIRLVSRRRGGPHNEGHRPRRTDSRSRRRHRAPPPRGRRTAPDGSHRQADHNLGAHLAMAPTPGRGAADLPARPPPRRLARRRPAMDRLAGRSGRRDEAMMDHHPIADLFPMLADDELKEMAEDIRERGLLQPIVLDGAGRVLDRRHLTKGQQAMVAAQARSLSKQNMRSLGEQTGLSATRISQATTVLQHAPDLADAVISGAMSLNAAYEIGKTNKEKADGAEAKMVRVWKERQLP